MSQNQNGISIRFSTRNASQNFSIESPPQMPRMFLNLYETTYMEHALACTAAGQRPFPALVLFMTSISHVSLAINRCVIS